MLNQNDKREAIRRVLHDFVMLKLTSNTKVGEVAELLERSITTIYQLFEADLTEYREMVDAMKGTGYFNGAAGLTNMVKDHLNYRRYFDRIRLALGVSGQGYLASDITEQVERLAREHYAQQQRDFDFIAHNDMREVLEDAGYSPDADGIKALVEELKEHKRTVIHIETVMDGVDPKLRKEMPFRSAVSAMGGELLRARNVLRQIHRSAAEEINR